MTSREVRVVYTKYDGSLHWHKTMRYLGEDEHGIWLGAPGGISTQRGSEPPVTIPVPHVMLFPAGKWWTAAFNDESAWIEIYCDISTPPQWTRDDEVTMVDLDLDVVRRRADGLVQLLDADEFAEHRVRYGYPADIISMAEESAEWLQAAITTGAEPFAGGYRRWLDQVS